MISRDCMVASCTFAPILSRYYMFVRLYKGLGGLGVLESVHVRQEIGLPIEAREVQENAFPVLRLGLAHLRPKEELHLHL